MAEPNSKLKNYKVLSVTNAGMVHSKRAGKDVPKHEVVLQGVDDATKIVTGGVTGDLPEALKVGNVIEDIWVYQYGDDVSLFFPAKKGEGQGGKKSYGGGYQEDVDAKWVGFAGRYVLDQMISEPNEFNWETYYDRVSTTATELKKAYVAVKAL
jgi:hypothetical protein